MIVVFVPYHSSKHYVLRHLFNWIDNAELPDAEVIIRCDRGTRNHDQSIKKQREFARLLAVEKQATHLLYIDADTIPPLDVLPKLLESKESVVGALYYGRKHGTGAKRAVAWKQGDDSQSFLQTNGLVEVDGMGMGCVLLDRKAFTSFSFMDWGDPSDDFPAFDALRNKGFKVWLDTTLVCKHYKDENEYS